MTKNRKQLHEAIRAHFIAQIADMLTAQGEEVLRTKTNEIAIPCVDEEGNDEWCVISFKVPTGSRDDGEPYDGYGVALQFKEHEAENAEKAAKAKAAKEAKIARDKAAREAKAKAKAEYKAKTEGA